jgi:myo-inositol-1(or 4)-monophosphatase
MTYLSELVAAKVAARNAGKILLKYYLDENKNVQEKGEDNPVTDADFEADKYIKNFLTGEFPSDGWLSEETVDDYIRLEKKRIWVVDPLDGTKEFIEQIPQFCVSIALVENQIPVVGVIFNPVTDELFYASKNSGAFKNQNKILCSEEVDLKKANIAVSRSEFKRGEWSAYQKNFSEISPIGSIAYKIAKVADQSVDCFATIAPKNEWDICAADCIINEAGGVLKTIDSKTILYNQKKTLVTDPIIASNSNMFYTISDLLY